MLAIDSTDNIYLLDNDTGTTIKKFTADGEFIDDVVKAEKPIRNFTVDSSGNIYAFITVVDSAFLKDTVEKLIKYNASGKQTATLIAHRPGVFYGGMTTDAANNLYVSDKCHKDYCNFLKFNESGTLVATWTIKIPRNDFWIEKDFDSYVEDLAASTDRLH